jgi:hypothetical protein
MSTVDQILELVKTLSPEEHRRLLERLDAWGDSTVRNATERAEGPYTRSLTAAGSLHSPFADLSTDKYMHAAAAALGDGE